MSYLPRESKGRQEDKYSLIHAYNHQGQNAACSVYIEVTVGEAKINKTI